eukprot:6183344-Pleurochrysis_carterae.AAC.4
MALQLKNSASHEDRYENRAVSINKFFFMSIVSSCDTREYRQATDRTSRFTNVHISKSPNSNPNLC